jgi:hypothetical protein
MTLTLHIPTELEFKLHQLAKAEGKPPEELALEALQDKLSDNSSVMLPRNVWRQEFDALLASMPNGNVEADLSRASVYEGRGE